MHLVLVHSSTREEFKREHKYRKPRYRDLNDVYAEVEARMFKRISPSDVATGATGELTDRPTSVDQQRRINATRIYLGLEPIPKILLDKVNALSADEQEDLDRYESLLKLLEVHIDNGDPVVDVYKKFVKKGMLEKRNGETLSLSAFHRWVRKLRKKMLKEQGATFSRMPQSLLDQIQELVNLKKPTRDIYVYLSKRGLLHRQNGGPDYGYIAVRDRVMQARKANGVSPYVKSVTVMKLHNQGKTRQEIMNTLGISYTCWYQHAIKLGIIQPKKRTA